jgi:hypothetical protein
LNLEKKWDGIGNLEEIILEIDNELENEQKKVKLIK